MINVKDQIYAAISGIPGIGIVSDVYPARWEKLPAVQYIEEDNRVAENTDDTEKMSYVRYMIHIWNSTSTSQFALEIDAAVSELGLRRIQCSDVEDPSGLRHKVMRFEGIIDEATQIVYQQN